MDEVITTDQNEFLKFCSQNSDKIEDFGKKLDKLQMKTEAHTSTGIAVSLVETILNSARILRQMETESKGVLVHKSKALQEALKELCEDTDLKHFLVKGYSLTGLKIEI